MNVETTTPSSPSSEEIEARFNAIWPELQSRAAAMSRRYTHDKEEAESEALASMAANFTTAARRGKWLPPTMLAHFASTRLRVGRQLVGNAVNEPLSAQCRIRNKSNAFTFSHLLSRKRCSNESPTMTKRLVEVLTSDERESPANRCATKLDWEAFVETQPARIQRVLTGLAEGHERKEMAKAIRVSPTRLTQLMDNVKLAVLEFFGEATPDFIRLAVA